MPPLGAASERRLRLDDPWLELTRDAEDEDRLSGWMADDDADTLARLAAAETRALIRRLTAPSTDPLAVPYGLRVIDRFRAGSGGLRVTLAWPARNTEPTFLMEYFDCTSASDGLEEVSKRVVAVILDIA
ncbi:hypothetical protein ACFVIY_42250 [Streptomyces sp. NPDC127166]|uniref:hypothetical protein n=1 Tax=Streptomyces sp. NPDC127166 TaxID=3345380 RepID=UPI00363850AB